MFIRWRLQLSQDMSDDRFRSRSEHKVIRNLNFRIDLLTIAEAYTQYAMTPEWAKGGIAGKKDQLQRRNQRSQPQE